MKIKRGNGLSLVYGRYRRSKGNKEASHKLVIILPKPPIYFLVTGPLIDLDKARKEVAELPEG